MVAAGPVNGQAVVQPIPGPEADRLAEAMRVLAQQPEDLSALLQAGDAALYLGDLGAAQNFYARARDVAPQDGRVAAGHAVLLVRQDQPVEALAAFDQAEAAGADMAPYAADRGLAYDLVGNNAAAQAEYNRALSLGPDNTVTLRLAISQAIAGDRAGFEATLLPLLQQGDLSAFRMRAFALAINGQQDEAVSIAQTMLPERLSSRLAPYLRYMPRLTRAQQAAAAHLGQFPQAHQIGQDDPAIAQLARQASGTQGPVTQVPAQQAVQVQQQVPRTADARLVPSGAAMGTELPPVSATSQPIVQPLPAPVPAPQPDPVPPPATGRILPQTVAGPVAEPTPAAVMGVLPPVNQPAPAPVPEPVVVATAEPQMLPAAAPATSAPEAAAPASEAVAPTRAITQAPVQLGLTEAFATFVHPAAAPDPATAGGVDITTIEPPRERPRPPAPPPPPPVPSRHWVQLATGRDVAALGFDWRRIRRAAGDLLQDAKPHLADWDGRTRLLAGPYSESEATSLVTALKDAGVDSFPFTSAKGEDVRALD